MAKHKNKKILYLIAFLILVAVGFVYQLLFKGDASQIIKASDYATETSEITEVIVDSPKDTSFYISVYICGKVNSPGVYELPKGSIINDAVILAGGMTEDAAKEYINLVYVLNSNISIYIPAIDEIQKYADNEYIYRQYVDDFTWGDDSSIADIDPNTNLVNINTASIDELQTLPGIGEVLAKAIIDYRIDNSFTKIEDIMNVAGIGESKYNKIKDYITV